MHPDITFRTKSNKKKISNEMNKVKMEVQREIQEEGGEVGMLMSPISAKQLEEPGGLYNSMQMLIIICQKFFG